MLARCEDNGVLLAQLITRGLGGELSASAAILEAKE